MAKIVKKTVMQKMSKGEIEKAKPTAKNFLQIYDNEVPGLVSKNISLQKRALKVVEEKIDQASAAQAATIYGILHDKVQSLVGNRTQETNTFNMYFSSESPKPEDMMDLMGKVMNRMQKPVVVDAEVKEETETKKENEDAEQ